MECLPAENSVAVKVGLLVKAWFIRGYMESQKLHVKVGCWKDVGLHIKVGYWKSRDYMLRWDRGE